MTVSTEDKSLSAKGKRALRALNDNFEEYVLVVLFTILTLIVANEVFRRFVLNDATRWGVRTATYIYVIASWIGAAYAVRMRIHLKIELFQKKLPQRIRFVVVMLSNLLFILFVLIAGRYLLQIVELQRELGRTMFGFRSVEIWPFYALTLFGMGLMIVRLVQNTVKDYQIFMERGEFIESEPLFIEKEE